MGAIQVSDQVRSYMLLVSVVCFGGAVGGLVNAIMEPVLTFLHMTGRDGWMTHMHGHRATSINMVQHRILWGALWGLIFIIPLHKRVTNFWLRSFLFALAPSLVALLVMIPASIHDAGILGMGLGLLTPLFVLLCDWIFWAIPAYLWVGLSGFAGNVDSDLRSADASDLDPEHLLP